MRVLGLCQNFTSPN